MSRRPQVARRRSPAARRRSPAVSRYNPPVSFDLTSASGLSDGEVAERLRSDGYNELPASKPRSLFAIALEVVGEPMFLLLVASGGVYLAVGDLTEGILLLGFVFVVMGITLYQQRKTERALEALRDLSSPRALVIRNGGRKRIPGREVVRGDLVMLAEGDRVPADGALLDATGLTVDESLLTGESVPVRNWRGLRRRRARPEAESRKTGAGQPASTPGPGAMTCPTSSPARWSFRARVSPRSRAPGCTRNSGRSDGRCGRSSPRRPRSNAKPVCSSAGWRCSAAPCARSSWWSTASRAEAGSTGCWRASRSPWPPCRRSSRSS